MRHAVELFEQGAPEVDVIQYLIDARRRIMADADADEQPAMMTNKANGTLACPPTMRDGFGRSRRKGYCCLRPPSLSAWLAAPTTLTISKMRLRTRSSRIL